MKIKILKDVTAKVGDRSVRLKVDEIQDFDPADAENLIAGGYAEKYGGVKPAVKVQAKPKGLNTKTFKGE